MRTAGTVQLADRAPSRRPVDPESIQIAVDPAKPVRELRQAIRSAIADVRGADNVPERAEPYNPHMSLGYINSDGVDGG